MSNETITSTIEQASTVTPRQARRLIKHIVERGHVPNLEGSPGIGKTAVMSLVAEDLNLQLLDVSTTARTVEDFSGVLSYREDGRAEMIPLAGLFPMDGLETVPEGKNGWLVFLDELPNAAADIKKACYKLLNQHLLCDRPVHPSARFSIAGNRAEDGAAAVEYDNGMKSRIITITMRADLNEWIEDVALPRNIDPRIIAVVSQYPNLLNNFDPSTPEAAYGCPRQWEAASNLLTYNPTGSQDLTADEVIMLMGTVGSACTTTLAATSRLFGQLPKIDDLLNGTANLPVDREDLRWALMMLMVNHMGKDTALKLLPYVATFDRAMQVLFFRASLVRFPELTDFSEYGPLMRSVGVSTMEARV